MEHPRDIGRELTGQTIWRDGICYLILRAPVESMEIDYTNAHLYEMGGRNPAVEVPWSTLWDEFVS